MNKMNKTPEFNQESIKAITKGKFIGIIFSASFC